MSTYSYSQSTTFTVTHAKHLASKIAADLNACSRLYNRPSIATVDDYTEELVELLRNGYLKKYEFGFQRDDKRVLSWSYTVDSSGNIQTDERAGKMFADVDLSNTTFFNFLWYTDKYFALTSAEKENFKGSHSVSRSSGDPPGDGAGYWTGTQKNYSSGGTGISRNSFRAYQ